MCTVTYIPINKTDFILTSNRDVPFVREHAISPREYIEDDVKITYPKDGKAGGTWIGHSNKNRLICLLNGGFNNHVSNEKYRKSRGIIVKDLLKRSDIYSALSEINLLQIEPFTLVIVDWKDTLKLIEFVWDGTKKHLKDLPQKMHIWSSATLYDAQMKKMREEWFTQWQHSFCPKHMDYDELFALYQHRILNFHKNAGIGKPEIDVFMRRENVGTVSVTQVTKKGNLVKMDYLPI